MIPTIETKFTKSGAVTFAYREFGNGFPLVLFQRFRGTFGTDSGVSNHWENAREFQYMVEAGMPPMEAILSATRAGADLLGASDRIGSVQPGRFADLIAVAGNPLTDIAEMRRLTFVMKGGVVVKLKDGVTVPGAGR